MRRTNAELNNIYELYLSIPKVFKQAHRARMLSVSRDMIGKWDKGFKPQPIANPQDNSFYYMKRVGKEVVRVDTLLDTDLSYEFEFEDIAERLKLSTSEVLQVYHQAMSKIRLEIANGAVIDRIVLTPECCF